MSVKAFYRKDTRRWYASFHDAEFIKAFGKRKKLLIPEATGKKDAIRIGEAKRRELLATVPAIRERRYLPNGRPMPSPDDTFAYFVDGFYLPMAQTSKAPSTIVSESWRCRQLKEYFGQYKLSDISFALCVAFQTERKGRTNQYGTKESNASVNRICEVLQTILSVAVDLEILTTNPAARLTGLRELPRSRILSFDEESRLAEQLEPRPRRMLRLAVLLALNAGLRKGEILKLTASDLDFERRLILVRNGKTGNRFVPLNSAVKLAIESTVRLEDGLIFGGVDWIKDTFPVACREAGITNLHFHDLRATYTTRMLENGFDAFTAMDATGHQSIKTTAIYARITSQRLRDAVESLGANQSPIHLAVLRGNFGPVSVPTKKKDREGDPVSLAS